MPTFREDPKLGSKVPMIKTADLNEQCVTNSKILDGCITKEKLAKGTVDATTLANKSVGTEKLSDSSVTNEKISNKAVSTEKLADGSITKEKIFNASITTEKLANESVSAEKLQSGLRNTIASTYDKTIELDNQKANIADVGNAIERLENKIGERFIVEGDVTNLPDEEDLTSVSTIDGREVMKLNDRAYEPSNFSGKGYKILRKNIKKFDIPTVSIVVSYAPTSSGDITITVNDKVTTINLDSSTDTTPAIVATKIATDLKYSLDDYDISVSSNRITLTRHNDSSVSPSSINVGNTSAVITVKDGVNKNVRKNVLRQDMINDSDTVYEIKYDFDLNNTEFVIPANCILKFNQGSLKNGTIKGDNTLLKCDIANLINIKLEGIFSNDIYKLSWFTDNSSDDINTLALQNIVDNQTIAYICIDISLNLTRPIEINHNSLTLTGLVRGSKSTISVSNTFTPVSIESENISSFFYLKRHLNDIIINNIIFNGKFKVDFAFSANNAAFGTTNYAKLSWSKFNYLECRNFLRAAIRVHSCEQLMIENSRFQDNNCAIYISRTNFDYTNILNIKGSSKFPDNIIYVKGCYIQRNNYGIITSFGTDFTVQQCTFGQSSTYDIFVFNGISFNYIDSYSEGAGNTRNWIDKSGITIHRDPENINTMVPQLANNHTDFSGEMVGWGLIRDNLYNRNENNKCIRPTAFIKAEVVSISDVFISLYDSRNIIANNEVDLSINDKIGIDTIFHIEDSEYRNSTTVKGISIYDQRGNNLLPRYLVTSFGNVNCNFINIPKQYLDTDFYTNLRQTFNIGHSSVNVITNFPAKKHPSVDVIVRDDIYNAADVLTRSSHIEGVQFYKYNEGENTSVFHGFRLNKENFQKSFIVNLYVKKEEGYTGGFIRVYAGNNISDKRALSYLNLNNFVFDSIKLLNVLVSYSDIKSSDKYIYLEVQPSVSGNAQTFSFTIPSIDYLYNPTIYRSEIDEQRYFNIGKTEHRPSDRGIGTQFYDTTLKKYIVWNGTEWTNMDGTAL